MRWGFVPLMGFGFLLLYTGCKSSSSSGINNGENTLAGSWTGKMTTNLSGYTNQDMSLTLAQTQNGLSGTFSRAIITSLLNPTNILVATGTVSVFSVSGSSFSLSLNQTTLGCNGFFVARGTFATNSLYINSFFGNDTCNGSHDTGTGNFTRQGNSL